MVHFYKKANKQYPAMGYSLVCFHADKSILIFRRFFLLLLLPRLEFCLPLFAFKKFPNGWIERCGNGF